MKCHFWGVTYLKTPYISSSYFPSRLEFHTKHIPILIGKMFEDNDEGDGNDDENKVG